MVITHMYGILFTLDALIEVALALVFFIIAILILLFLSLEASAPRRSKLLWIVLP
jgi:hypothetical protein